MTHGPTAGPHTGAVQWLDGGLSTALERLGFSTDHPLWTALALVKAPELVVEAHRQFLGAGAQIVLTASYQAGIANLTHHTGSRVQARRLLASSVHLARRAVEQAGRPDARVAASLGAYGALLADRSEYHGRYDTPWSDVAAEQRARMEVLLDAGPDLVVCETLPTLTEAQVLLEVLDDLVPSHPGLEVWLTFTAASRGRTAGGDPLDGIEPWLGHRPWVTAVGVNCTEVDVVEAALVGLRSVTERPLVAEPNAVPTPETMRTWVQTGARYLGGCCGVGPAELASITSTAI